MTQALDDFFAGGTSAAKFEDRQYGTVIGGEITSDPRMTQQRDYTTGDPITYPDGNPAMQMVVTVQAYAPNGDDDGQRAFYIKGQMREAVREALKKVGAKRPERGGRLFVRYERDEPTTLRNGKPGNPQKIYAAKYEPPTHAAAGDYFDAPAAAPASAPPASPRPAAPPAGVDPAAWARMSPEQQRQLADALGGPAPAAATAGGFNDEPPF